MPVRSTASHTIAHVCSDWVASATGLAAAGSPVLAAVLGVCLPLPSMRSANAITRYSRRSCTNVSNRMKRTVSPGSSSSPPTMKRLGVSSTATSFTNATGDSWLPPEPPAPSLAPAADAAARVTQPRRRRSALVPR